MLMIAICLMYMDSLLLAINMANRYYTVTYFALASWMDTCTVARMTQCYSGTDRYILLEMR